MQQYKKIQKNEEIISPRHTEELSPSCHTEERGDVSIHKMGTRPLNSEKYQPSLDSYGSKEPQNEGVGKNLKYVILRSDSDVRIHNHINSESGRSMVEMLGVLAVIGVLSITAVAGYSYAMTKNKTNQILNGLSKAQVMIQSALDTGANDIRLPSNGTLTSLSKTILKSYGLDEYDPVGMGCPGDTYDVVLNNIPTDVCKMLVADGVGTYIAVDVRDSANENKNKYCRDLNNPNESCTTNDEKVQIAFTFEKKELAGGNDCGYCHHKEGEKCVKDAVCDNGCSASAPVLTANGACRACPTNVDKNSVFSADSAAECEKCPRNGITYKYNDAKKQCELESCPQGYYLRSNGACADCFGNWSLHSLSQSEMNACLAACPNRVVGDDGWGDACVLPNYCTGPNQAIDSWGDCIQCDVATSYWDPQWGSCALCPGISFSLYNYGDQCVIDCPQNNYGENVGRCCHDNEVYTDIGYSSYGHQYGACCPKTRPVWNGNSCVSAS